MGLLAKFKELESVIQPLVQIVSALEYIRKGITSSFSSSHEDGCFNALEAYVKELQGMISDVVDDCRSSMEAIRHEVGKLSAELNLTIRVVGN